MIKSIAVRFFVLSEKDSNDPEYFEVSESCFLECEGEIEYTRNTVWQKGVDQVCLYKSVAVDYWSLDTI